MRKLYVVICDEHARVRKHGDWMKYTEFLLMLLHIEEPFELVYERTKCDKCKEEANEPQTLV